MKLGDVVASLRKKKSIEQKDLAKALGVSITYISLIENNKKRPSPGLLKSIADYFGIPVSVLLFNALMGAEEVKKGKEFKIAELAINRLVDFLISDKEIKIKEKKSSIKTGKKPVKRPNSRQPKR